MPYKIHIRIQHDEKDEVAGMIIEKEFQTTEEVKAFLIKLFNNLTIAIEDVEIGQFVRTIRIAERL